MAQTQKILRETAYDAQGNILSEFIAGIGGGQDERTTYTYDALNRLTSNIELIGGTSSSYQYDSLGNLARESANGTVIDYTYNSLNQLVSKLSSNDAYSYSFDQRGNLTEGKKNGNIVESYVYDATNRMVMGVNDSGETSRYGYNGLGYLTSTERGGVKKSYTTDYTSALKNVIMETDSEIITRYTYGLTKNSVAVSSAYDDINGIHDPMKLYTHTDRLGSTRFATYSTGAVMGWVGYDEWGNVTASASVGMAVFGANGSSYREIALQSYTGYMYDEVLDKYFAQARMYDPNNKRFMAVDPVKGFVDMPLTLNPYVYVLDNPLLYIDPMGEFPDVTKYYNKLFGSDGVVKKAGNAIKNFGVGVADKAKQLYDNIFGSDGVAKKIGNYIADSGNQVIKGNYAEKTTLLGTAGEIVTGFIPGLSTLQDGRDLVYNLTHWDGSVGHAAVTALSVASLIPFVSGGIKIVDKAGDAAKVFKVTKKATKTVDKAESALKAAAKKPANRNANTKRILNSFNGKVNGTAKIAKKSALQGFTNSELEKFTKKLKNFVKDNGLPKGELAFQGSRVKGTATIESDLDIILRVDKDVFDKFTSARINSVYPGSKLQKTLIENAEKGQFNAFSISKNFETSIYNNLIPYSPIKKMDFSIILKGSKMDTGPFIYIK